MYDLGISREGIGGAQRCLCTIYENDLEVSAPEFTLTLQTLHRSSHKLRRYRRDKRQGYAGSLKLSPHFHIIHVGMHRDWLHKADKGAF